MQGIGDMGTRFYKSIIVITSLIICLLIGLYIFQYKKHTNGISSEDEIGDISPESVVPDESDKDTSDLVIGEEKDIHELSIDIGSTVESAVEGLPSIKIISSSIFVNLDQAKAILEEIDQLGREKEYGQIEAFITNLQNFIENSNSQHDISLAKAYLAQAYILNSDFESSKKVLEDIVYSEKTDLDSDVYNIALHSLVSINYLIYDRYKDTRNNEKYIEDLISIADLAKDKKTKTFLDLEVKDCARAFINMANGTADDIDKYIVYGTICFELNRSNKNTPRGTHIRRRSKFWMIKLFELNRKVLFESISEKLLYAEPDKALQIKYLITLSYERQHDFDKAFEISDEMCRNLGKEHPYYYKFAFIASSAAYDIEKYSISRDYIDELKRSSYKSLPPRFSTSYINYADQQLRIKGFK